MSEIVYDFCTGIKTCLLQLAFFLNFIFLKLVDATLGEIPTKVKTDENLNKKTRETSGKAEVKPFSEIPGPKSFPIFGTYLTSTALASNDLMKCLLKSVKKYGTLVKEEYYWNIPIIYIHDADDLEKAMKLLGSYRPGMEIICNYRATRPDRYDHAGIVNVQGAEWELLHKATTPFISSPKFVNSCTQASDEIAMDFLRLLDTNGLVIHNAEKDLMKFVLEASFYNIFGKRVGFIEEDDHVPEQLKSFTKCAIDYFIAFDKSTSGYPWWKHFPSQIWKNFVAAESTMIDILEDFIQKAIKENYLGDGVLSALMNYKGISYNDKRTTILELATGATDPVLVTIIYNLYYLSKNKQVANRLYEELREIVPHKDTPITNEMLTRMQFLKACIMETSRICPAAPNIARVSEQPMELGGYHIPAYSVVLLQTWYASMQDTAFYRAKEFLPERWIYKDGVPPYQPHHRSVLSNFGYGTRACPGRRIALQHITVLMARVFRKYEVQFDKDLEVEYKYIIVPAHPVSFQLLERED